MQLQLAFELRSPDCGAPHRELYAAMLDICAWADELGFDVVNFGEHHGADEGPPKLRVPLQRRPEAAELPPRPEITGPVVFVVHRDGQPFVSS